MKRFVTYLYECERGDKTKNVGFIRVNVRGEETIMEVYLRNLVRGMETGRLFVLLYKDGLQGLELGEVSIVHGQSDAKFAFETENIKESGAALKDIVGIGICFHNGGYIASCWKDEYADEIAREEFTKNTGEEEMIQEMQLMQESSEPEYITTYEKIDLSQIRELPSPNWHLATNSFLVHGFWNYGYLVLKKDVEADKETISLGIPGIFEKPEAVMAVFFGFPSFEEMPKEVVNVGMNQPKNVVEIKENQEAKTGDFGCWFVRLKM